MKFLAFALAMILAAPTGAALADGVVQKLMTPADKTRLEQYDATRKAALAEAKGGGDPAEFAALDALLAKPLLSLPDFDLGGEWRCRTTKVGGLSPLVVYGWFKCRVSDDGSGWKLEKTSGSQRTTGRFYDDGEKRLIYLGSFFIAGETPKPYGSGPESDQIGYAFRTGPAEWRIEFPAPHYESKLDILEFRR
jgi:hypothetical protein